MNPQRKRRLAAAAILVGLVVGAVSVGNRLLASRIRAEIESAIVVDPDVRVSVDDIQVSIPRGQVRLQGVELSDPGGIRVVRMDACAVHFGLRSLTGRIVHIRQLAIEGFALRMDLPTLDTFDLKASRVRASGRPKDEARFAVSEVRVHDADIVLLDGRGRERFSGRIAHAVVGEIVPVGDPQPAAAAVRAVLDALMGEAGAFGLPDRADRSPATQDPRQDPR